MSAHVPVLLDEAIEALLPRPGGRYIDGTFGGGGHTRALLEASAPDGMVLAIDRDPEAHARATDMAREAADPRRLRIAHDSFTNLLTIANELEMLPVDGILLDLGISSFQVDDPSRGFSFSQDGPLDMRFDTSQGESAADLVNTRPEPELAEIIWRYGEEHRSRRIAGAIVAARTKSPVRTTAELASIVEGAVGGRRGSPTHPATRTFQAIRIAVNDELRALAEVLPDAVVALGNGGRLAVIAFHSLEDRIVKQYFRRESSACLCPPEQPVCTCGHIPSIRTVGKAIKPGQAEVARNPRSRSAVLRVAEKLPSAPEGS